MLLSVLVKGDLEGFFRIKTPADDTVADQALGPDRVIDHAIGPDRNALPGSEERLGLTIGQCDRHHGMPARLKWAQILIRVDHRREVHAAVRRLKEAAGMHREGARAAHGA